MKNLGFLMICLSLVFFALTDATAQCGGSHAKATKASYTTGAKDVVDIAIGSKDHTTLVAAVKAADLVSTLKSDGPFTIFAPTNAAFDKLPNGTVETLLKPENKKQLATILTYHVVAGNLDSNAVIAAIKASKKGKAKVETVSGGTLVASIQDGDVMLEDENGNMAKVTAVDLKGSNGVIHVIDTVVLPQ